MHCPPSPRDKYVPRQNFQEYCPGNDWAFDDSESTSLGRPAPLTRVGCIDENTLCDPSSPISFSRELIETNKGIRHRFECVTKGKGKKKAGILKSSDSCKSASRKSSASGFPPSYVVVAPRKVEFHGQVVVFEVDRVVEEDQRLVWWSLQQMDRFRQEAAKFAKSDKRSKFGIRRSARGLNHIRRVLLQQDASEELDGVADAQYLAKVAAESSKKSRDSALRGGLKVEKEVEEFSLLHPKMMMSEQMSMCLSPRVADYYLSNFFSAMTETLYCGSI